MNISEKALMLHEQWNGKLEVVSKVPVKSREDLSIAYTPGVAEPCKVIAQDKEAAYKYTMISGSVPDMDSILNTSLRANPPVSTTVGSSAASCAV